MTHDEDTDNENDVTNHLKPAPGTLPPNAALSKSARGLLMRLLEPDPRVRMKSLRQLEQSAFFLGYKFDPVKTMQVSPRSILERYFMDGSTDRDGGSQHFEDFESN